MSRTIYEEIEILRRMVVLSAKALTREAQTLPGVRGHTFSLILGDLIDRVDQLEAEERKLEAMMNPSE